MKKDVNDIQLRHNLNRLTPELARKYGVNKLGFFYDYTSQNTLKRVEVNIIVELQKPLGWKFFEMKEFLEKKLFRRIDIVTPNGIKVLYKPEIISTVKWL